MKKFLEKIQEDAMTHKPVVMAFGRMNPPTIGHEKLVDRVKQIAKDYKAPHHIIISHSVDAKKNPLDVASKLKHAKRFFPGSNIEASSKEHPTFLQHAQKLFQAGHDHLIMVAGSDRIPEYENKLKQYNGVGKGSLYNFKKIEVKSAGHRDPDAEGAEGMSASKMREHASNNNFGEFKQGIPSHVPEKHAKELFRDVRRGMGINENYNRGLFKAIFVTGGPGSGKDVIIREAIAERKAVELNVGQAFNYLMDKKQLSEKSGDFRREAIRNRGPLIINGPADDYEHMIQVKEELEELGYNTTMVFVDTTNEASYMRNQKLTKMIAENARFEKWTQSQQLKETYNKDFRKFIIFNNSGSLSAIEEDITDAYEYLSVFLDEKVYTESAYNWLESHGKLNTNDSIKVLVKEEKHVEKGSRFIQKFNERKASGFTKVGGTGQPAETPDSISADNRAGDKNADNIKWDSPKKRGTYTFRTYSEETGPKVQKFSEPKETNFSKDNDKEKHGKKARLSPSAGRVQQNNGIGSEYDSRAGGQGAAAGAGLGNQTYSEGIGPEASNGDVVNYSAMTKGPQPNPLESGEPKQPKSFSKFKKNLKEFNGFQNDVESGVGGTLGGASNKEPMEDPKNKVGYTYDVIKNKKKAGVKK